MKNEKLSLLMRFLTTLLSLLLLSMRICAAENASLEAADALRATLPEVSINLDLERGVARHIAATNGFLARPNVSLAGAPTGAGALPDATVRTLPDATVRTFLSAWPTLLGGDAAILDEALVIRDDVTATSGLRTKAWQQVLEGIPVHGGVLVAHTTRQDDLIAIGSGFVPAVARGAPARAARQALTSAPPQAATEAASAFLRQLTSSKVEVTEVEDLGGPRRQKRLRSPGALGDIQAALTWYPVPGPALRLAWEILLVDASKSVMYNVVVDAADLAILSSTRLTSPGFSNPQRIVPPAPDPVVPAPVPTPVPAQAPAQVPVPAPAVPPTDSPTSAMPRATSPNGQALAASIALRVYTSDSPTPFSPGYNAPNATQPSEVPRTLVTLASLDATASPEGWIDGNRETRGNNVDAHLDLNGDDVADTPRPRGSGSAPVTFDFPLGLSQSPATYRSAAVTNLFYWCNVAHDRLYQLGFTETAGNFQNDNFGRGGAGNDAVQADAQDGSGANNANMSTPPDGSAPRMQMFVFTDPNPDRDSSLDATVILHEYVHGLTDRLVGAGVVGSLAALQSGGMGEGWSDFYALSLLSEPTDVPTGTYAAGAYLAQDYFRGFRRYPYAIEPGPLVSSASLNPLTFSDISLNPEVHDQGEVWCQALWECRGELIAKLGPANGNQVMLQLVTDGLKLTPANPSFIQARDAIIQADLVATGGAHAPELWRGFTKRGLGRSASVTSSNSVQEIGESFENSLVFQVSNAGGLRAQGSSGIPSSFSGTSTTFVLTNPGTAALEWSVSKNRAWLTVSPSSGTLAAGGTATVTAAVVPSALAAGVGALTDGIWRDAIAFKDATHELTVLRPATVRVGGNYTISTIGPVWIDAAGHTTIPLANNGSAIRPLGFTFPFYGVPCDQIEVDENGYVILRGAELNGVAVALGQDLDPTAGGSVRLGTQGTAPNRTTTITWTGVPPFDRPSLPMTFQIVLEEASGDVLMNYAQVQPGDPIDGAGRQAQIGVENQDGYFESIYSRFGSTPLTNNLSLRYRYTGANPSPANAAPTVSRAAAAVPATIAGTSAAVSVLGADDGGESALLYSWSLAGSPSSFFSVSGNGTNTGKSGTITFTQAGSFPLRVTITDAGGKFATSNLTAVVNQTLSSLSISPATATVARGGVVSLAARGADQFGNAIAVAPSVTWTVLSGPGSIDANGLFTSSAPGSVTIRAQSGPLSATATITVAAAVPPTVATAATATPSPVIGKTTTLMVVGADDQGESALIYTWSAIGAPPAPVVFSSNGTNESKTVTATFGSAGTYSLRATITDGEGQSVTSDVVVVVNQTPTALAVSPTSVTLTNGATGNFSAAISDQFGTTVAPQPTITWTITSGPGSVTDSGVFQSNGQGTAIVNAQFGTLAKSVTVTVTPSPDTRSSGGNGCGLGGIAVIVGMALLASVRRFRPGR